MIRLVIFLVVLILTASYFGISLREVAESPAGTDNFSYAWEWIKQGWQLFAEGIGGLFRGGPGA